MTEIRTALGLMSGTSLDGIDAALLYGDGERVTGFGPAATTPFSPALRRLIERAVARAVAAPEEWAHAPEIAEAAHALTLAHAEAVHRLLDQAGLSPRDLDVIGFHGQTVLHRPERGLSVQIGDGQLLAELCGAPVAGDFRRADVAAGGQGAPLAPLYHAARARALEAAPVAVLNLGGVANITWIGPDGALLAFDTGPGNGLIDAWCATRADRPFDAEGALAAQGRVVESALAALLAHPFFAMIPPKSLDRYDFSLAPVEGLSPADGAATLGAFTAAAVAAALDHLPAPPALWVVCGGGRHNPTLMHELSARLPGRVVPAEAVGWRGDAIEAEAFAFLALRVLRGLPLSLPETTGVPRPLPGGRLFAPPGR